MSRTITLPNWRATSDGTVRVRLKDGGVYIDWSGLTGIKVWLYSDVQKAIAGRFDVSVSQEDPTILLCDYSAQKPQYLGINRIIVQAKYHGRTKTYDKPAMNIVARTAELTGEEVVMEDPVVDVEIVVEDVSSSILDNIIAAALDAAARAEAAAQEAEHMVNIHTGPQGPAGVSPVIGENGNWFAWDDDAGEFVDTGKKAQGETGPQGIQGPQGETGPQGIQGPVGVTPDISIGTVTTVEPGQPAAASMTGTPEDPVLNLSIPQGLVGATPNFTIGTVTTGEPGTPVVVTITGTAEAPVLNITIPRGAQGNTGSSVAYPFELVNNLSTNDATKALSAAQGVVLDGKISQLEAEVDDIGVDNNVTPVWTGSKYIKQDGTITNAGTSFSISDYIEVSKKEGVRCFVSGVRSFTDLQMPSVHLYDANKVHIGFVYANGNVEITEAINTYSAVYVCLSQYNDSSLYPFSEVRYKEYLAPKYTSYERFKNATNYVTPENNHSLSTAYGAIGVSDGIVVQGNTSLIYTEKVPANVGRNFKITNGSGVNLTLARIYCYKGDSYVGYKELGAFPSIYAIPPLSVDFDSVRFCFGGASEFSSPDAITVTTLYEENIVPVKTILDDTMEKVSTLERKNAKNEEEVSVINRGRRLMTQDDVSVSVADKFKVENGSIYGKRAATDPQVIVVFNEGITAIEFEIASLWDSNFIYLVFGIGVDSGNNNSPCFASCNLETSSRPNETGFVSNYDYTGAASAPQESSLYGTGRFSGQYRNPQVKPYPVSVGDKCRIELIDGSFFNASVYDNTSGCWKFWWCLDTKGDWNYPNRLGWNTRKTIGLSIRFATITEWKELIKNVYVISETDKASSVFDELARDLPPRKQWTAIGDSITAINGNNGLSYVGYAQRKLGHKVYNKGLGGWTIYKLWRDRDEAGWEDSVSLLNDGDIVTILAGTDDFDTASFSTPANDDAMDAAAHPHPRFGTTDPTSEDAKDPHTTLGCLRLMIERILTLKPGARLVVFSPFYREKGASIGSTGWNKMYVNSEGRTIYDYADAIYSVAREYNLPAYNTCRDCGINVMTLTTYTYDDLHIGQVGGELIGDYVAKRIS